MLLVKDKRKIIREALKEARLRHGLRQQDVAEALCIVLDRLHDEWKVTTNNHAQGPLGEESIIYKIFRGIRRYGKDSSLEMFTTIHLAPPGVASGGFPLTPTKSVGLSFGAGGIAVALTLIPRLMMMKKALNKVKSDNEAIRAKIKVIEDSDKINGGCCCCCYY